MKGNRLITDYLCKNEKSLPLSKKSKKIHKEFKQIKLNLPIKLKD